MSTNLKATMKVEIVGTFQEIQEYLDDSNEEEGVTATLVDVDVIRGSYKPRSQRPKTERTAKKGGVTIDEAVRAMVMALPKPEFYTRDIINGVTLYGYKLRGKAKRPANSSIGTVLNALFDEGLVAYESHGRWRRL